MLPGQVDVRAAEMAVGSGLSVYRTAQVQAADDPRRAEGEVFNDQSGNLVVRQLARAEGVNQYGDRFGDADGVSQLNYFQN